MANAQASEACLYPIVLVQDRYSGAYSGGAWLALAEGDRSYEEASRIGWIMSHGPSGNDLEAAAFWQAHPAWIATGKTPDEAIARLRAQNSIAAMA